MTKRLLFFTLTCILLASCQSYKKVPYLQDSGEAQRAVAEAKLYDARIMPKDLLTIVVSCTDPELAEPFNLTVATPVSAAQSSLTSQPALQQYLVDNRGNIEFPILGTLHIGGLTKSEAETLIKGKLSDYIKESANYKISVIGEVNAPGTFTISNEKVNLFEALAMAGDMTVYGLRDNVRLIREDADGHQHIITLDMNRADIVQSPYYYLQQNDILYVTPNKTKAKTADISTSTTIWFSVVGTLVSLASLIITIAK